MSLAYLIALGAVCIVILATLAEALLAVSRKPKWAAARPALVAVSTADRRTHALPYVGTERRTTVDGSAQAEADQRVA